MFYVFVFLCFCVFLEIQVEGGVRVYPTVNDKLSEGFINVLAMVCFSEQVKIDEELRSHYEEDLLFSCFGYWLSSRNDLIPKNDRTEKRIKIILKKFSVKSWESLMSLHEQGGKIVYLWWYDYNQWEKDAKNFRVYYEKK